MAKIVDVVNVNNVMRILLYIFKYRDMCPVNTSEIFRVQVKNTVNHA
jgi:hypothetical protein